MRFICGIDEVGRGPLAGPVVASAVILPQVSPIEGLKDSKMLNPGLREELSRSIQQKAIATGLGWVWHAEIDRINIHHASLHAMILALDEVLGKVFEGGSEDGTMRRVSQGLVIQIDGKFLPDIRKSKFAEYLEHCDMEAIIKGDSKVPAISAASILAKVTRDTWMEEYHHVEPAYGFDRHKGYPTVAHKAAIRTYGASKIQRLSFNSK